uniref:Ubiquitin-like domain-containing protein n=1 Tax=Haptolina brevifila TaxID=156173 RepID=A0A7S2IGD2_9EUKA|mmetsp:Transcript_65874/g.130593  ORF Transcript_65874/g.130593 Transcript_65874/m.130593 type:complete len:702 (+) Transcript_65874:57-2162(+)
MPLCINVVHARQTHPINVSATATIADLKSSVAHLVPAAELIHKGKKLQYDSALLVDMGICDQARVMLMNRPRKKVNITLRCLTSGRIVPNVDVKADEKIDSLEKTAKKALALPEAATVSLYVNHGKQVLWAGLTLADYALPDGAEVFALTVSSAGKAPVLSEQHRVLVEAATSVPSTSPLPVNANAANANGDSQANGNGDSQPNANRGSTPSGAPARLASGRGPVGQGQRTTLSLTLPSGLTDALNGALNGALTDALSGALNGVGHLGRGIEGLGVDVERVLSSLPVELQAAVQVATQGSPGGGRSGVGGEGSDCGGGIDNEDHSTVNSGRRISVSAGKQQSKQLGEEMQQEGVRERLEDLCSRMVSDLAPASSSAATQRSAAANTSGGSAGGGAGAGGVGTGTTPKAKRSEAKQSQAVKSFGSGLARGFLAAKPAKRQMASRHASNASVTSAEASDAAQVKDAVKASVERAAVAKAVTPLDEVVSQAAVDAVTALRGRGVIRGASVAAPPVLRGPILTIKVAMAAAAKARAAEPEVVLAAVSQETAAVAAKANAIMGEGGEEKSIKIPTKSTRSQARLGESLAKQAEEAQASAAKEEVTTAKDTATAAKENTRPHAAARDAAGKGTEVKSLGQRAVRRCAECDVRLPVTACLHAVCRCGQSFCTAHMHQHHCTFDYKTGAQKSLRASNPKLAPPKLSNFI